MRLVARLRSSAQWLFQRPRAENELDDELRDHIERETEHNIRAGFSPEEAKFATQRLVGSLALYKEECRDAHGIGFFEHIRRDLRYAARTLRRTPLFTAIAIVTLALGIGANTTVFTFVENILLRSLPLPHASQLVSLNLGPASNLSYPNYLDFRDRNRSFSALFASRLNQVNLGVRMRDNSLVWGYEATATISKRSVFTLFLAASSARLKMTSPEPIRCWSLATATGRAASPPIPTSSAASFG